MCVQNGTRFAVLQLTPPWRRNQKIWRSPNMGINVFGFFQKPLECSRTQLKTMSTIMCFIYFLLPGHSKNSHSAICSQIEYGSTQTSCTNHKTRFLDVSRAVPKEVPRECVAGPQQFCKCFVFGCMRCPFISGQRTYFHKPSL